MMILILHEYLLAWQFAAMWPLRPHLKQRPVPLVSKKTHNFCEHKTENNIHIKLHCNHLTFKWIELTSII